MAVSIPAAGPPREGLESPHPSWTIVGFLPSPFISIAQKCALLMETWCGPSEGLGSEQQGTVPVCEKESRGGRRRGRGKEAEGEPDPPISCPGSLINESGSPGLCVVQ